MRNLILVMAVIVAACGSPPSRSGQPAESGGRVGPVVDCGDIGSGNCEAAAQAALRVVAGRGSVLRVELGGGVLCRIPDFLFEKTSCPGGPLGAPAGGSWIGHAVVTFWAQERRAYMDVARTGSAFTATLITFATPPPSQR